MKRILAMLLTVLMLVSLAGCHARSATNPSASAAKPSTMSTTVPATSPPTEEPTERPTEAPTEAPTERPTEAPTEEPTERPTEAPTEVPTERPTEAPTEAPTESQAEKYSRYGRYIGSWQATKSNHFMYLLLESGIMYLEYSCVSANGSRIAEVLASVEFANIQNDLAIFHYSDDGWGNSGTITLDFSQPDQIGCTTKTTYKHPDAQWGINAGNFVFVCQP